jgi:hypothetical protein
MIGFVTAVQCGHAFALAQQPGKETSTNKKSWHKPAEFIHKEKAIAITDIIMMY